MTQRTDRIPAELCPILPVCWATMDELQTEDALDELQEWVAWAVDRYALDRRVVPECWDSHGALIEELSALRTSWIAAFCITGRPEAPLEWHNQFEAARNRLADWASRTGCRPGEHRADR